MKENRVRTKKNAPYTIHPMLWSRMHDHRRWMSYDHSLVNVYTQSYVIEKYI